MAKGKQTFNKSEREKRKRKEKLQKEERREDRKANNKKGRSFEEMFAYVDEYGRLSNTPPDPTKKIEFKAEDVEVSTTRRVESEDDNGRHSGIVSFFNEEKGYGFIKESGSQESYFVHVTAVEQVPREGDKVTFRVEKNERGLAAVEVKAE
jgi:cold shock CspA family protein